MKNCVFLYNALSHHLSSAHRQSEQNIPVPKNDHPKVFSLFRETPQIFCPMKYSLLSLLHLKSNILEEKTKVYECAPQLLHSYLSRNQTLPLFYKTTSSPCRVSLRPRFSSYTLGTIPNGICSHKQHDLCGRHRRCTHLRQGVDRGRDRGDRFALLRDPLVPTL